MSHALSIEIYQLLEEKLGREDAKKVSSAIELGLEVIEKKAGETALQKKLEIEDDLSGRLASKADLQIIKADLQTVKTELEGRIELVKTELGGRIELARKDIDKLDMKLNFLLILMIIALTLMNPVMAEVIL